MAAIMMEEREEKTVFICVPIEVMAEAMVAAIRAARSPYSSAVAPSSDCSRVMNCCFMDSSPLPGIYDYRCILFSYGNTHAIRAARDIFFDNYLNWRD